jgi:putative membrane protein
MIVAKVLIGLVAAIHLYILVLEMFLWRGRARRVFKMTEEKSETTAVMAANQGLYNGFLAAGLIWALATGLDRAPFFLICVAVAGIYGAFSVQRTILYVQTIPAAAALLALYAGV